MLTAKLFGGLAGVIAFFAFLTRAGHPPALDLYIHDTYYVIGHFHWQFGLAMVCASFAFVAFATQRWGSRPLNTGLGITSFILIVLGFGTFTAGSILLPRMKDVSAPHNYYVALSLGMLAFLLGCVLFAVNVLWALSRMLRGKLTSR